MLQVNVSKFCFSGEEEIEEEHSINLHGCLNRKTHGHI